MIVALAALGCRQDPAGMIDEAQRFFDVALAVAGFRIVFPDEAAQRRTHFLVARRGEDAQRVVQRRLHAFGRTASRQ